MKRWQKLGLIASGVVAGLILLGIAVLSLAGIPAPVTKVERVVPDARFPR